MQSSVQAPKSPFPIVTMLTPTERLRVDAAGEGSYRALHRDSVAELVDDLKSNRASAVILSITRCDGPSRAGVAALVREFPRVPTVALLTQLDRSTPHTVLSLGSTGVRQVVDVRDADGWRELRNYLLAARGDDIQREALGRLAVDLAGVSPDCWRFFEALFLLPARVSTIRALARRLGVLPSTLMSRFFRARLPAPKQYLSLLESLFLLQPVSHYLFRDSNAAAVKWTSRASIGIPAIGRWARPGGYRLFRALMFPGPAVVPASASRTPNYCRSCSIFTPRRRIVWAS